MRNTVDDLMKGERGGAKDAGPVTKDIHEFRSDTDLLFTVRLIIDPAELEIIDGKVVFEKRVVARSLMEAHHKSGLQVV